jgi:hypothetical protein
MLGHFRPTGCRRNTYLSYVNSLERSLDVCKIFRYHHFEQYAVDIDAAGGSSGIDRKVSFGNRVMT